MWLAFELLHWRSDGGEINFYIFIWLFILVYGFNLYIYTCMPRQETYVYNFALRNEHLNINIIYQ